MSYQLRGYSGVFYFCPKLSVANRCQKVTMKLLSSVFSSGEEEQFLSKQCAHLVANGQISNGRRKEKPLNIQSGIIWHFQVIMGLILPFTYSFVQLLSFVGYISEGKCTCSWSTSSSSEEECRVVWPMPVMAGLHWRAVVIWCEWSSAWLWGLSELHMVPHDPANVALTQVCISMCGRQKLSLVSSIVLHRRVFIATCRKYHAESLAALLFHMSTVESSCSCATVHNPY